MLSFIPQFHDEEERPPERSLSFRQIALMVLVSMIGVVTWEVYPLGILLLGAAICIGVLMHRLDWGVYALAAFSFFHEWEIDFSRTERFRELPYIPQINAPIADIVAIFLCIAVCANVLLRFKKIPWKELLLIKKNIFWYLGFLIMAALAILFFMHDGVYTIGIKYWLRPMLFTWLMYWLMTIGIIMDTPAVFRRVLHIWFGIGIVIALYGVASFFVLDQSGWMRALPFSINGFAPLGFNHNQMAEALVAILPIAVWFSLTVKDVVLKRLSSYSAVLIGFIALLTLSRAAWIAIICQMVILGVYLYRLRGKRMISRRFVGSILLFIVPILMYMATFLTSSIVSSSTSARLDAAKIAGYYALQSPFLGYGPGSFIWLLSDTAFYTMEYGEPLDAHGFAQKILVEEGVFGFIFFIGFIVSVLWFIWRAQEHKEHRELALTLFIMATGAVMFQLFNTSYFNSVMWMPLGIATAGAMLIKQERLS